MNECPPVPSIEVSHHSILHVLFSPRLLQLWKTEVVIFFKREFVFISTPILSTPLANFGD